MRTERRGGRARHRRQRLEQRASVDCHLRRVAAADGDVADRRGATVLPRRTDLHGPRQQVEAAGDRRGAGVAQAVAHQRDRRAALFDGDRGRGQFQAGLRRPLHGGHRHPAVAQGMSDGCIGVCRARTTAGVAPYRLHQRRALEGFDVAEFVEHRLLPAGGNAHGRPVHLLLVQRRGEQRPVLARRREFVALHRRHHPLGPDQAQALQRRGLRAFAAHAQPQGGERAGLAVGEEGAVAVGARVFGEHDPAIRTGFAAFQLCRTRRVLPRHFQAGHGHRFGQVDLQLPRAIGRGPGGHRMRLAGFGPQRGGITTHAGDARRFVTGIWLELEYRHAPVRRAVGGGQAQVARLHGGEHVVLDAAHAIAGLEGGAPLLAVVGGLEGVRARAAPFPVQFHCADRHAPAEVHLVPVPWRERPAPLGRRIAIDGLGRGHLHGGAGGTGRLPRGPRGQGVCRMGLGADGRPDDRQTAQREGQGRVGRDREAGHGRAPWDGPGRPRSGGY